MSVEASLAAKPRPQSRATSLVSRPIVVDGFLSPNECARVRGELEFTLWRPSLAYQRLGVGCYRNTLNPSFRVSETAFEYWFSDKLTGMLAAIERRMQEVTPFDRSHLEAWQATSYARDGFVDYHLDSGYWDDHPFGERELTFLIYLTTPRKGGSTHFRALDLDIPGKQGRLLIWRNLFSDGGCDHRMIHSGTPLLQGRKLTLVTWTRQKRARIDR